jgi:predicted N-acetyltransferase YhbS
MVARYLPFAGYRIDIASVNAGFTVMLREQPFGQAGDSIVNIRDANKADAQTCGRILYDAFKKLAERHNFPPDFPSPEVAAGLASMLIGDPGFYGVVAEEAGTIVGSNFMDERSPIFGIGPISVAPEVQNHAVGRRLMCAVLDRATAKKAAGIRLVQAGYHNRSLCLYTKLGFVTREPLSLLQGPKLNANFAGYDVRLAEERDVEGCNKLCREVHGFDRDRELRDAIRARSASVVEHLEEITGYATAIGIFAHAVARTNQDLKALIGAATEFQGPGFLLPTRNHDVFEWCLSCELKLVFQMTLMTTGLYNEPAGAYLPSILY